MASGKAEKKGTSETPDTPQSAPGSSQPKHTATSATVVTRRRPSPRRSKTNPVRDQKTPESAQDQDGAPVHQEDTCHAVGDTAQEAHDTKKADQDMTHLKIQTEDAADLTDEDTLVGQNAGVEAGIVSDESTEHEADAPATPAVPTKAVPSRWQPTRRRAARSNVGVEQTASDIRSEARKALADYRAARKTRRQKGTQNEDLDIAPAESDPQDPSSSPRAVVIPMIDSRSLPSPSENERDAARARLAAVKNAVQAAQENNESATKSLAETLEQLRETVSEASAPEPSPALKDDGSAVRPALTTKTVTSRPPSPSSKTETPKPQVAKDSPSSMSRASSVQPDQPSFKVIPLEAPKTRDLEAPEKVALRQKAVTAVARAKGAAIKKAAKASGASKKADLSKRTAQSQTKTSKKGRRSAEAEPPKPALTPAERRRILKETVTKQRQEAQREVAALNRSRAEVRAQAGKLSKERKEARKDQSAKKRSDVAKAVEQKQQDFRTQVAASKKATQERLALLAQNRRAKLAARKAGLKQEVAEFKEKAEKQIEKSQAKISNATQGRQSRVMSTLARLAAERAALRQERAASRLLNRAKPRGQSTLEGDHPSPKVVKRVTQPKAAPAEDTIKVTRKKSGDTAVELVQEIQVSETPVKEEPKQDTAAKDAQKKVKAAPAPVGKGDDKEAAKPAVKAKKKPTKAPTKAPENKKDSAEQAHSGQDSEKPSLNGTVQAAESVPSPAAAPEKEGPAEGLDAKEPADKAQTEPDAKPEPTPAHAKSTPAAPKSAPVKRPHISVKATKKTAPAAKGTPKAAKEVSETQKPNQQAAPSSNPVKAVEEQTVSAPKATENKEVQETASAASVASPGLDLTDIQGLGAGMKDRLILAGIGDVAAMASADLGALRLELGAISRLANLDQWQADAKRLIAG